MIQCPNCRAMIPDDSAFCDQCGTELMWCPDCKRPKPNRGRECPVCGTDLVTGRIYLNGNHNTTHDIIQPQHIANDNATTQNITEHPQTTSVADKPKPQPTKIVGNGWILPLREGQFGRRGGVYPEFATCQYISGNHGTLTLANNEWTVTDNGSTNGTYINDVQLIPGQGKILHIGDKLTIATIDFNIL